VEYWFDRATKVFAREDLARREVLKSLALTGVASLLPGTSWAQSSLGEAAPPAPAPCTLISIGGKRTTTVSASAKYRGQLLTLSSTSTRFGRGASPQTFFQRVELDGKLLYELTYNFVPAFERTSSGGTSRAAVPTGRLEISYGSLIRGPRHVLLKIENGAIQGFADGHAISNERRSAALATIEPDLQIALRDLSQQRAAT
jgi:hypothetical protein